MGYTSEQIREKLQKGKGKELVNKAVLHQNRIRFHTVKKITRLDNLQISQPLTQFLAMAENILPHDKFVLFKTMFRFPQKSCDVVDVCFDKLARIFDGRNPVFNYHFTNPQDREDWEDYRLNTLREPEKWKTVGWQNFKTEINSILVCDLPAIQESKYPEVYFYWLKIDNVLAFSAKKDGSFKYLIYKDGEHHIVVLDDESYRVWDDPKDTGQIIGEPMIMHPHSLGYTPARFFWNDSVSLDEPFLKESPLTKELDNLDWFLFFALSKRQLDLMGAYPILSGYEPNCDYSNSENGDYCDGGFLKDKQGHYRLDMSGLLMRCPKCGQRRTVGPGSYVEIPVPNVEENQPDLRNPVQMLSVDRDSLDYNVEEENRLRYNIIQSVCGEAEIITNRAAFNEQQVKAFFESQVSVLNRIKIGFEKAQTWVDDTICKLRYGDYYIACQINYGDEFFLASIDDLRTSYKLAKESGASETELDALQEKIIETQYRNDPLMMQRMKIMSELEPYRHLTREEIIALYDKGLVSERDLQVKLNFPYLIKRFERENINVLDFGSDTSYDSKIQSINNVLTGYVGTAKVIAQ